MTAKNFRKDINGLRALAVAAVLVFHFSNAKLPGGFVGVDVFFVISGFLMTSIIFRGFANDNFSIIRFLIARARRIVPAMMLVIGTAIVLGYLLIDPANYKDIGKNGFYSLLFISNIMYNRSSGYFDVDEGQNAFLHTWSLSVEWQFYIVYPIVLALLHRLGLSVPALKRVVLVAAIALFGLCLYLSFGASGSPYFLFPARAWEMLLGGLAFLFPLSAWFRQRLLLEILGLAIILASFWLINQNMVWPGYMALLPTVGTFLVIWAANPKSLLSNVVFQKVGLISYSLYLVHWVLLAFLDKMDIKATWVIYLIGSFLLATITYFLVERRRDYKYKTVAVYLVVLLAAYLVSLNGGAYRIKTPVYALEQPVYAAKFYGGVGFDAHGTEGTINGDKAGPPDFILTGDSLARQYAQAIQNAGLKVVTVFTDGCFSTEHYINWQGAYEDNTPNCERRYATLKTVMNKYPDIDLVTAHNWGATEKLVSRETHEVVETSDFKVPAEELSLMMHEGGDKRRYFFIGNPPGTRYNALYQCLAQSELWLPGLLGKQCATTEPLDKDNADEHLRWWTSITPNAYYIDLDDILCKDRVCTSIRQPDHLLIYTDRIHFSTESAKFILPGILKQFHELQRQNPKPEN